MPENFDTNGVVSLLDQNDTIYVQFPKRLVEGLNPETFVNLRKSLAKALDNRTIPHLDADLITLEEGISVNRSLTKFAPAIIALLKGEISSIDEYRQN
ncbi:hypothetical protein JW758_01490 [Candidatus Peregrinibacteria bacterium]|nr:hypothetical protein [Candidatus Peregrinibacteria bacterium]